LSISLSATFFTAIFSFKANSFSYFALSAAILSFKVMSGFSEFSGLTISGLSLPFALSAAIFSFKVMPEPAKGICFGLSLFYFFNYFSSLSFYFSNLPYLAALSFYSFLINFYNLNYLTASSFSATIVAASSFNFYLLYFSAASAATPSLSASASLSA